MTTNRFGNLFDDDNADAAIMPRISEIEIKLSKISEFIDDETGETTEAGVIGSFKLIGDIGTVTECATDNELEFIAKLMARFRELAK